MILNKHTFYLEKRVKDNKGSKHHKKNKCFCNSWRIIAASDFLRNTVGIIRLSTVYFPESMIGKKVRFKVEVIDEKVK